MKKYIIILTLLVVSALGVVFWPQTFPPVGGDIPDNLKLKVPKSNVLASATQDRITMYSYYLEETVPTEENEVARTENSYTVKNGDKYAAKFFPSQKFVKKNGDWHEVRYATTSYDAFKQQTLGWFHNALADTFNPNTGNDSMYNGCYETYAGAHDASASSIVRNTTWFIIQHSCVDYACWSIERAIINFDTSGLPDSASVTSATLQLYNQGVTSNTNDTYIIFGNSGASATQVVVGDFDQIANTDYSNAISGETMEAGGAGYYTWTFNAAGIAAISTTGVTKLGGKTYYDKISYQSAYYLQYTYFNSVSGANPPILTVEYTGGATPTPPALQIIEL